MPSKLNPKLCKAARALAGWNQAQLAETANVAKQTVADFERGARTPFRNNLAAIERALEGVGVRVVAETGGEIGVRMAPILRQDAVQSGPRPSPTIDPLAQLFERHGIDTSAQSELRALLEGRPKRTSGSGGD
ncbi:MAG: helix-turn-helix transcriptional regulator [Rhodospirillales bacterium]|nr:helix-turn-helix transcriptional regulator [Rhodospirillales bacterium]